MDRSIPIPTLHLFPVLNELLIDLLRSLSPEDWNKPTLARQWTVKDVAAHLLDTNMRAITSRDAYTPPESPPDINSYSQLVIYLNELNADWVKAIRRVSPAQLIDLLDTTGKQHVAYLSTLEPFAPARYSVAWAGEEQSLNWFDIAREYTEKWHHQQQIREAVGKTDKLMTRQLFYPCIDTFMNGLPHVYRNVEANTDSVIHIMISGDAGGDWYLIKKADGWIFKKEVLIDTSEATVIIKPDVAWKLFTKAISPDTAIKNSIIKGDVPLANNIFNLIAVMA